MKNAASAALLLAIALLGPAISQAQSPWRVTLTPTMNPLPIGLCGAVHLTVKDAAINDAPRNGLGARISIADFDMSVTAPGNKAVAGHHYDAYHWDVCACGGASVGSTATVTAIYPAQALPAAARVPGVSFRTTATFVIAPAKGSNPPACLVPAPKPAAVPAPAPGPAASTTASPAPVAARAPAASATAPSVVRPPATTAPVVTNNAPSSSPASSGARATNSQAATTAPASPPTAPPQSPPAVPTVPQIPSFPDSTADWAAWQESMGAEGWAELQKALDEFLDQKPDPADFATPPEVAKLVGGGRNHAFAVAAFKRMLPVLKHARCMNCHSDITFWDQPAEPNFDIPARPATHKGGDINIFSASDKEENGSQKVDIPRCNTCHTQAPPEWNSGPVWTDLNDFQLCAKLKGFGNNGKSLLNHLGDDALITLAFQGRKAIPDADLEPPPLSYSEFMRVATEWINRMDAMEKYPKSFSEGCPRTDGWTGAIEYTYTYAEQHMKEELHGAVHLVADRAEWSALAAHQVDNSARNCPSVTTGAAAGDGSVPLVNIDETSENAVRGFSKPNPGARPSSGPAPSKAFVGLTILAGKYNLAIDLPMRGTERNNGGGSACPGYKTHVQDYVPKISETAGGIFDRDNPDEISGTKTYSPYPGASITMKWQFMRMNNTWGDR